MEHYKNEKGMHQDEVVVLTGCECNVIIIIIIIIVI
jgi:hypothetical protein